MTPIEIGFLGTALMVALLFTGISVGVAMALVGFIGFAYLSGLNAALGFSRPSPTAPSPATRSASSRYSS